MDSRVWTASGSLTYERFHRKFFFSIIPISKSNPFCLLSPKTHPKKNCKSTTCTEKQSRRICTVVMEKKTEDFMGVSEDITPRTSDDFIIPRTERRLARKRKERNAYLVAAVMSSLGVSSAAIMAVYYRFSWQMQVNKLKTPNFYFFFFQFIFINPFSIFFTGW